MSGKVYLVDDHLMQMSGIGLGPDIEGEILREAGFTYIKESCHTEDEIIERCADADVIFNLGQKMGEKTFAALKNCKAFLRYGIGFDVYDVEAATKYGKMICNMPTYCVNEVATQAVALALAASRAIYHESKSVKEGIHPVKKLFRRHSMRFTTFGLLGFGNIAKKVAEFIKPYGGRLIAYDPFVPQEVFDQYGVEKLELDAFLAEADFISVHTPLNKHTFHLLDTEEFSKMKDGVIIVNTSRGPVISSEALIEALQSGKVAAAGLDTYEGEMEVMDKDYPLYTMPNVILTPHTAYESDESTIELRRQMAFTGVSILKGEIPFNVVNKKALGY